MKREKEPNALHEAYLVSVFQRMRRHITPLKEQLLHEYNQGNMAAVLLDDVLLDYTFFLVFKDIEAEISLAEQGAGAKLRRLMTGISTGEWAFESERNEYEYALSQRPK